jgi:large subunit ribosomal protein L19
MIQTDNIKTKENKRSKNLLSSNLIKLVEAKFVKKHKISGEILELQTGDIIRIGYLIPEGDKDRTQYYEGLIIAKQNRGLGQSFTLRRTVQGVGVEQVFVLNSPKIVSITRKQSSKVRRAKLYYLRSLSGKATRLKAKI